MSLDHTVYYGPYVECKVERVEKIVHVPGCTNKECGSYHVLNAASEFCPQCGSSIGTFEKKTHVENVDYYDWYEGSEEPYGSIYRNFDSPNGDHIENEMSKMGIHVWMPILPDRLGYFDPQSEVDIREIDLQKELKLLEYFQGEGNTVDFLRQAYGKENVTVKWGVLNEIF